MKTHKAKCPNLSPHFAQRWDFVKWLPSGGQADPYVVRDRVTGEQGVLKQPKKLDQVAVERFRREIDIVQNVQHPSIVRLLDYSSDEQELGYVTPLGRLLRDYWDEKRAILSPNELYDLAFAFLASIAEGLAPLHEKNVVHRDLKARNIIVLDQPKAPQPVVIDFGLAFRVGDERLSIIDDRLVHNMDTSPAEAYYRHIDPSPAWDCIGLGWLYGFLVGAGRPDNNRFHWKFHPLVDEPRASRVRALLAMCSDLDYAPGHARGFRNLMDTLGLGRAASRQVPGATNFSGAHAALKDAQAASQIRQVEQAEQLQVISATFSLPLTDLRTSLREVVKQGHDLPIHEVNSTQTGRDFHEHFYAAFNGNEPATVPFYWIKCGNPNGTHFYICCYLEYEPRNRQPGDILFNLRLDCRHSKGVWNDCARFYFEKDGSFSDSRTGTKRKVSCDEIVSVFSEWLLKPAHWSAIG